MPVLLVLLLAGCSQPFTVATYNAGLAVGFVDGAAERTPGTAAALAAIEADVVCAQEVWLPDQVTAFSSADTARPHQEFPDPDQDHGTGPACTEVQLTPVASCVTANCSGACIDDLPDCVFSHCALPFLGLPRDCMRCVQANIGGDLEAIQATCTSEGTEYAYDGSFGTGLLSAWPLTETEHRVFPSTTNRRGVQHAVVKAPGGKVDVYCTHLTPIFQGLPYPREEGSWGEEQRDQIRDMLEWIDATATTGRVVLLGDLNTGPESQDADAEASESWALLEASSLTDPYVDQDGRCTLCSTNPLSSLFETGRSKLIDHVLIEGWAGATAGRILDVPVDVETCGETLSAFPSDHFGVRATLER